MATTLIEAFVKAYDAGLSPKWPPEYKTSKIELSPELMDAIRAELEEGREQLIAAEESGEYKLKKKKK